MAFAIITGGIGAGKSSLVADLAALGADCKKADDIVHDLYIQDAELVRSIEARVGQSLRGPDGLLDRKKLAQIVFTDSKLLKAVEELVHPKVEQIVAEWLNASSSAVQIYEVPIWQKTSPRMGADLIVEISAPQEVRLQRLLQRGLSQAEAAARIDTQERHMDGAGAVDRVIQNQGSISDLQAKAAALYGELVSL